MLQKTRDNFVRRKLKVTSFDFWYQISVLFACVLFLEEFSMDLQSRVQHQAFSVKYCRISWFRSRASECGKKLRWKSLQRNLIFFHNCWEWNDRIFGHSHRQPNSPSLQIWNKNLEKSVKKFRDLTSWCEKEKEENLISVLQSLTGFKCCDLRICDSV